MTAKHNKNVPEKAGTTEIEAFLTKVAQTPFRPEGREHGRLIFALDATASREPMWDVACDIQADMFSETASLGRLSVQLIYYRGFGEVKYGPFTENSSALLRDMVGVYCLGGRTQIGRILNHALTAHSERRVSALVFIGDACEEDIEELCHTAGEMGMRNLPVFIFHEGEDVVARRAFQQIAQISGGAYCQFDSGSAKTLRDLLGAVAVYAVGGHRALEDFHNRAGRILLRLTAKSGW
jgi:Mg-chelatase subunit ChlD|tara:strand:- start:224 stop:937 length:714 start_codon:yes stop_codon:yes gene_type:complete